MSQAPDVEESRPSALDWKTDPAWHQGKAEWALYDATRPVYGQPRAYEATIFTNKQRMDPETTTKASDWQDPRSIEVFKHNVSELIPTPNYVYRFLTTAFVRTDTLELFKLTASTQEDCGSTFKQFTQNQGTINEQSFSYFANEGERHVSFQAPDHLAFHDTLSLTLRDYPFQASIKPELELQLVPDQTSTHQTGATPAPARVRYVSLESISLPYGDLEAHHLVVEHETDGKSSQSEYWFASDPGMRHVMVKYEGPYGLRYELKRLDWWAYWSDPKPDPSNE
ncbi:MAG: hypothetical protein O7G85_15845 [Planctomycetota bacterium]|nr:hypothetical protein [Planctomycetota bacterium]